MISDDLYIPDFLRRAVTPENEATVARLNKQLRRGGHRRVERTGGRSTISTGYAANLDDVGKALLKEVKAAEKRKRDERFARLRELKGLSMPKTGKKEAALRAQRESDSKRIAVNQTESPESSPVQPAEAVAEANVEESKMRSKTSKRKSKANARKAVNGNTAGVRPGTKLAIVAGLLSRKNGCTAAQVLKATGWPAVSMPQQARAAGLKLKKEKAKGEPTRYFAA